MTLDPQSWLQWGATTVVAAFTAILGLFVSFGRDASKVNREKVEALDRRQSEFAENYIHQDEFKDELDRVRKEFREEQDRARAEFKAEMVFRYEAIDNRHLQMHNHNAGLMVAVENRLTELKKGIDDRVGELREDIKDLRKRIETK